MFSSKNRNKIYILFIYFSIGNACAVLSMPRFLASGYGLSQSLSFLDKRIAGSGNEIGWKGTSDQLKSFRSAQNRTQTVMIDGVKSMSKDLNWGVPQGSVLGPILYLLYTSPVGDIIRRYDLEFHFYADDSQLYLTFEPSIDEKSDALVRMETCVGEIDWWMVSNKLKLNGDKTKLLIINARHRPCPPIDHIEVSNFKIQPSETVSNIGVTFDKHMSLDQRVTNVCKACFFHLRNIAKIRNYLSTADTEILVHALITSKLDSCNSLLYGLPKSMIDRLENVQNSAARL